MKKCFFLCLCLMMLTSCRQKSVRISINNPSEVSVKGRVASLNYASLLQKLHLDSIQSFQLMDLSGNQIPYQITFDHKVLFLINLEAKESIQIIAKAGPTVSADTICCGDYYKWRADDVAWENDLSAYRLYGPGLEKQGTKAYGYDIWSKRAIHTPIVAQRYAMTENHKGSYHDDHGNGMDMYIVGKSLGAGTSAVLLGDSIVMPYCYETFKILDNGPYRFTVDVTYATKVVGNQTLTEKRRIRCDAGTYMNRTEVKYEGTNTSLDVISGIVMHDSIGLIPINKKNAIAYADPTGHNEKDGRIFIGMYSPQANKTAVLKINNKRLEKEGIYGHAVIQTKYLPESDFIYYWGAGWQKGWIKDRQAWEAQMKDEIALIDKGIETKIVK